jgi:hypothetical protein
VGFRFCACKCLLDALRAALLYQIIVTCTIVERFVVSLIDGCLVSCVNGLEGLNAYGECEIADRLLYLGGGT